MSLSPSTALKIVEVDRKDVEWIKTLGSGHFGEVHLVEVKNKSSYAAKICKNSEDVLAQQERYYSTDGIGELVGSVALTLEFVDLVHVA